MVIVVYGMEKDRVAAKLRAGLSPEDEVQTCSDYDAAMRLRAGKADFGVGVCQSGAGQALAIPRALIGAERCVQLSSPSAPPDETAMKAAIEQGKRVFGFAVGHVDAAIPRLAQLLVKP